MAWLPQLTRWVRRRAGFRGAFLALLGAIDVLVGVYLLIADLPPAPHVILTDELIWGYTWIGIGTFLFTGVLASRDGMHFAAAALLKTAWAAEFVWLAVFGDARPQFGLLAAGWVLVAATVVLIASQPEKPKR